MSLENPPDARTSARASIRCLVAPPIPVTSRDRIRSCRPRMRDCGVLQLFFVPRATHQVIAEVLRTVSCKIRSFTKQTLTATEAMTSVSVRYRTSLPYDDGGKRTPDCASIPHAGTLREPVRRHRHEPDGSRAPPSGTFPLVQPPPTQRSVRKYSFPILSVPRTMSARTTAALDRIACGQIGGVFGREFLAARNLQVTGRSFQEQKEQTRGLGLGRSIARARAPACRRHPRSTSQLDVVAVPSLPHTPPRSNFLKLCPVDSSHMIISRMDRPRLRRSTTDVRRDSRSVFLNRLSRHARSPPSSRVHRKRSVYCTHRPNFTHETGCATTAFQGDTSWISADSRLVIARTASVTRCPTSRNMTSSSSEDQSPRQTLAPRGPRPPSLREPRAIFS